MDSSDLPDNLSDISYGTETENDTLTQAGGFLFGESKNNRKALEAAFQGKANVLEVLVMEDLVSNYNAKDGTNSTILHYIAKNPTLDPTGKLTRKILHCDKKILYCKDDNGDTPLSLAEKSNNKIFLSSCSKSPFKKTAQNDETYSTPMDKSEIESIMKSLVDSVSKNGKTTSSPQTFFLLGETETAAEPRTDDIIGDLEKKIGAKSGGTLIDDTEDLINEFNTQLGGKRSGSRKVKSLSEYAAKKAVNESSDDDDDNETSDRLSRIIKNQKSEIHDQVTKDIEDMIIKLKLKYKDPNIAARAIKAEFWKKIKEQFPNLSSLDKAHELKKMATEENVKNAKETKELIKIIEQRDKEREERKANSPASTPPSSPPPEKKSKKSKKETEDSLSETSSEEVDYRTWSQTSIDNDTDRIVTDSSYY